jgi:glycine/D-amino acid oxidase-like deaminating enzyme
VHACIVGGGLAGSLLAWRLAQAATDWRVDLLRDERRRADATASSGGAVRAYEPDAEQRRLATASMVELLASPTLRRWADYRPAGSVYVRSGPDGLEAAAAEIELMLPGTALPVTAAELARDGWAGLPAGAAGVQERLAGYTSPDRLRDAVIADAVSGGRVTAVAAAAGEVTLGAGGGIGCVVAGQRREYDLVVLAAGPWTPALLRSCALPGTGYRTKSIQYGLYPAGDWRPPPFVDELTSLYGRPTADGGMLLGLPTGEWDVDPDHPPRTEALHDMAARLARDRFPRLQIGPAAVHVGSADCYSDHPVLSLRPVANSGHQLFTFTGGSGGSVKTALAASLRAAVQLVQFGQPTELITVGRRKGQP